MTDVEALTNDDEVLSQIFSEGLKDGASIEQIRWMDGVFRELPDFWKRVGSFPEAEALRLRLQSKVHDSSDVDVHKLVISISSAPGVSTEEGSAGSSAAPAIEHRA